MSRDEKPTPVTRSQTESHGRRPSRRRFLLASSAVTMGAVTGCLGATGGTEGGSETPDTPWTTEALAEQIDEEGTITIYAGTGGADEWHDLIGVINDEFGTSIEGDVFASDAASVSQRFVQERESGEDAADIVGPASNLRNEIRQQGQQDGVALAAEWFESDLDQNFWFSDELLDEQVLPFQVPSWNAGAGLCMPVSEAVFDERGLAYPETYNDLFDEQYEGLDVAFSGYVSAEQVGWIMRHHAAETEMSPMEWAESLMDHLNVVGVDSHTAGTREVGKGNIPMMFYNWPQSAEPFVVNDEMAVRGIFPTPSPSKAIGDPISINKEAPNPWLARFFVSATLEESVQKRMFTDVRKAVPGRSDLDYDFSSMDIHPFTQRRMTTELDLIEFWDTSKVATTGQNAVDAGLFEP